MKTVSHKMVELERIRIIAILLEEILLSFRLILSVDSPSYTTLDTYTIVQTFSYLSAFSEQEMGIKAIQSLQGNTM